ncbi:SDR family oxidoreductase [Planctomicrobium sp. SH668]|uniref:SDR family oxidoreductase n=1 Tax=Planctomicrobium sp. SH668 TaxID=3448126 RepID=UPI003F5CB555
MNVLIIGCGYVGLKFAQSRLALGDTVSALTRQTNRSQEFQQLGITPIIGDVLEPSSLQALPNADLCLYAVGFDRHANADKRSVYVDGLRNVLDVISRKIPRLIYISSTSVYGQDDGEFVDENSPCVPTSEGGKICLEAEQVLREFYPENQGQSSGTIVRLSGIYGPGRLIARRDQLVAQLPIQANPESWLNLIHLEDIVQVISRVVSTPSPAPLYLASDETPLLRREFYSGIARAIGSPEPTYECSVPNSLNKRCSITKLKEELGVSFQFPNALQAITELLNAAANGTR